METFKPIKPSCGRVALLATACLVASLSASETYGTSRLGDKDLSRRNLAIEEAEVLLKNGDVAYTSGRYADAVTAYSGARDLIPDAPISEELRAAATERYAQASVEQARELSRKGDVAAAKSAVDKVLAENVAPQHLGALNFRAQLDDPIRTNPAITAEHAKNVDLVRRDLYTAEGAYNLGKFDQAAGSYADVLRTDPTNSAARRGMERVAAAKSNYQNSAYDHTRAEMLSQVDAQWELQMPNLDMDSSLLDATSGLIDGEPISVKNKIDRIIIPKIALDQSSLTEALDFLRLRASENDTLELDPTRKGVNFTVNLGDPNSPEAQKIRDARFDLQLTNVPLSQVLRYITDTTQTAFITDDFSVIIRPVGSSSAELVSRSYRVPPDFLSSLNSGASAAPATADPFSEPAAGGAGLLPVRLGAQEALAQQGVSFPEGASASLMSGTNMLRVVNTPTNQEYISQIIETLTKTEPVTVSLQVTMIRVEKTHLEELGFDWILDNFGFSGEGVSPGSNKFNLSGGTVGNGRNLEDILLPAGEAIRNPITAGNRSGDSAVDGDSVDNLLNNQSGRQANNPAPGIMGVRGNLSNGAVQMLMRGLNQKKGVDVMIKPSVLTRSGQSSSISVVREFPFATEYEPPELPNSTGGGNTSPVTPATPTAFETREVGVNLEVLPVVDENKQYINVTLNPVFSNFDGFVNYGSPINGTVEGLLGTETVAITDNSILMPIFSKQSVSTQVDVADGSTVVVGGLMQESVQNVEDQTPVLGSIPIIGRLFQSKTRKPTSTAIIFLVRAELLDPTGRPFRDR